MYTVCLSQRDQLRLGVDECMDRFNPSVKHHCYQVDFVPVVRNQGSDRWDEKQSPRRLVYQQLFYSFKSHLSLMLNLRLQEPVTRSLKIP